MNHSIRWTAWAWIVMSAGEAIAQPPSPMSQPPLRPESSPPMSTSGPALTPSPDIAAGSMVSQPAAVYGGFEESGPAASVLYASAEYLLWNIKDAPLPPLVRNAAAGFVAVTNPTTVVTPEGEVVTVLSPPNLLPVLVSTAVGSPTGSSADMGAHSGGRFLVGGWFLENLAGELSFTVLERRGTPFASNVEGNNFAVPVAVQTIIVPSLVDIAVVQNPILLPGTSRTVLSGLAASQYFGGEALARTRLLYWNNSGIDLTAGFRYVNLSEDLDIDQFSRVVLLPVPNVLASERILQTRTHDSIDTSNNFAGAQLGLAYRLVLGPFFVNANAKFAFGGNFQTVRLRGYHVDANGVVRPGGLLTAAGIMGTQRQNRVAIIPDLGVKVGCQITRLIWAYAGYDWFQIQNVVRPGNQIGFASSTTTITINGVPTTATLAQPAFRFNDSDVQIHGLCFGLELRF
ncbi:MAG: BBP7 family outer membrane beta-barrel protein [Gemmataceae bacterium]|nr:BBP7 family outer membrane beta-barrel protein [Gemmataceae bacterium]MDW8265623.1 BBP7 family outer membrane beta-barrel protein [Gemmataceae bacterium]